MLTHSCLEIQRPLAGWSFAKLFLSLELVQRLYDENGQKIESTKGKWLDDKFVAWLNKEVAAIGCKAILKLADEMVDFGRYPRPRGFLLD